MRFRIVSKCSKAFSQLKILSRLSNVKHSFKTGLSFVTRSRGCHVEVKSGRRVSNSTTHPKTSFWNWFPEVVSNSALTRSINFDKNFEFFSLINTSVWISARLINPSPPLFSFSSYTIAPSEVTLKTKWLGSIFLPNKNLKQFLLCKFNLL